MLLLSVVWIRRLTGGFLLLQYFSSVFGHPWSLQVPQYVVSVEFSSLIHHMSYP